MSHKGYSVPLYTKNNSLSSRSKSVPVNMRQFAFYEDGTLLLPVMVDKVRKYNRILSRHKTMLTDELLEETTKPNQLLPLDLIAKIGSYLCYCTNSITCSCCFSLVRK